MGQNSDTYNIFGSYFNSVLLKEQAMVVRGQELEDKKKKLETETDPIMRKRLEADIRASEGTAKEEEANPNLKRRDGESIKDYRKRQDIMKNHADYYSINGEKPDWNRELTPDEEKKMKEKGWSKEQTIGMADREKTMNNVKDTLKKQGKSEGEIDGVNYKITSDGKGNDNIRSTRITQPQQPQAIPASQPNAQVATQPATQAQAQPAAQEQSDDEIIASIRAKLNKQQQTK
jgi:hypothetical protein